jgi:hypothetical protein
MGGPGPEMIFNQGPEGSKSVRSSSGLLVPKTLE